ncbi:MAG TPA: 50S ribosomal protein L19e [Candidatus Bilamarchaeum sp.]|nr:50S ribosomal protein L19e [Candidatus Bilamarchaeum sp.]
MTIQTVRRLAADIMRVGENKVKISPDGIKEAEGALTRSDVKGLIEKGIVTRLKPQGRASTGRLGRRGHGKRKGHPLDQKDVWMAKIRSQRRFLSMIVSDKALKEGSKRGIYSKLKSGIFRNKKAMLVYLKENKLVAADYEPKKAEFKKAAPKPAKAMHKGEAKSEPAAKPHAKKGEQK